MANEWIERYFNELDLDVRKSHDGTWIDQKCTPDVICFVADCIDEFVKTKAEHGGSVEEISFTIHDIWQQDYSKENIGMFGKPAVKMTSNEYDKFFSQPIKLLNYAGVIRIKERKRQYHFTVNNMDLLEYIGERDVKALAFLSIYVEKVLRDSDAYAPFEAFFEEQTKESYENTKEAFLTFMRTYTKKGCKGGDHKDVYRIFTKALNAMAYSKRKKRTIRGAVSKRTILYSDLLYNRLNFRDEYTAKPKDITRKEFSFAYTDFTDKSKYEITKAKNRLRRYNQRFEGGVSEGVAQIARELPFIGAEELFELEQPATQMHHIFPQSQYPEIAAYLENLIALTPNQHTLYAHPVNNTKRVDPDYQYYLLLCKIERIRLNLAMEEKYHIYTFDGLIYVLCIGLDTDVFFSVEENDFNRIISQVTVQYAM